MYARVSDLVDLDFLADPLEEGYRVEDGRVAEGAEHMTYERASGVGATVRAETGAWVRMEGSKGHFALGWPTLLSVAAAWDRMSPLLPPLPTEDETAILFTKSGGSGPTSAAEALRLATKVPRTALFLRVDYPEMAVTWSGDTHPTSREVRSGSIGLAARTYKAEFVQSLISVTAPPDVKQSLLDLLTEIPELSPYRNTIEGP